MKRAFTAFLLPMLFSLLIAACVPTGLGAKTELTSTYRIFVDDVSDLDDLDSTATEECRIKVPVLFEVVSKTSYAELMERMDFVKIWVKDGSVWYVLGKWNYITINAEEDTCFVSSEIGDFSAHAQEVFKKLESHPEFFAEPGPGDEPYRWNGRGYVTMEQLEASASSELSGN